MISFDIFEICENQKYHVTGLVMQRVLGVHECIMCNPLQDSQSMFPSHMHTLEVPLHNPWFKRTIYQVTYQSDIPTESPLVKILN